MCVVAALSPPIHAAEAEGDGFVPTEFASYSLILLRKGPAWSDAETPENSRLQQEHLSHLEQAWRRGQALVCGPFDAQDDPGLRGLCLYQLPLEEARAVAEADPRVVAGQLVVEALTWWTGAGHLAFPEAPGDVLTGTAYNAKGGAILQLEDGRVVYLQGIFAWPAGLEGSNMQARGRLVEKGYLPEATVSPDGAHAQGVAIGSTQWVLEVPSWQAAPDAP